MNNKNNSLSLIIIIVVAIIMSIGCSPAPLIQSAHVNSVFKTGINVTGAFHAVDFNPYYLAFGIKDRVELSASLYPVGASANMKIFIVECGNEGLFRNIATAVFSGGKTIITGIGTCGSANAGIILSTLYHGDNGDVELVFQPSVFRIVETYYSGDFDHHRGDGLHVNCGTFLTIDPNRENRFSSGIRMGVGYQQVIKTIDYHPEVSNIDPYHNEWLFEFGIDFNWKSGRQMRKC